MRLAGATGRRRACLSGIRIPPWNSRPRFGGWNFRFRNGSNAWFSYAWLGAFFYEPSVGLLLKFTGDTVTLVLVHGSNLDAPVQQGTMTLMIEGSNATALRFAEMEEDELRKAGERERLLTG